MQIDYPAACNAAETLLVHKSLVDTLWPTVAATLMDAGVQLLCDRATLEALKSVYPPHNNLSVLLSAADESSYGLEHLSLTLSVKTVSSLEEAIGFINAHSSHHTDCIVTESSSAASAFCQAVDSAGTFVNASTRFADGFRYGFGTEVGISTGRIHARGPVGLEGLVIYKYKLRSRSANGHIVGEFGSGKKQFKHERINATMAPF
jgi:glutamate-5-semialdehyde dehydrogenase